MQFLNHLNQNTILGSLSPQNINNLLWELSQFYIAYRPSLNLDELKKFGLEIEYEEALQSQVTKALADLYKNNFLKKQDTLWLNKTDSSVHKQTPTGLYGGEINSPILQDSLLTWSEIVIITNILKQLGAVSTAKTSLHIHVDQSILGTNITTWLNFIKLWIIYEPIIYRFCYGEYPTNRNALEKYFAFSKDYYLIQLKSFGLETCSSLDTLLTRIKKGKYFGINFENVNWSYTNDKKNTIELRIPNGTFEPIIIQNTVYFFIKLLISASKLSPDLLNQRISTLRPYQAIDTNNIDVYTALELADLIFDNNYDKFCFLRQYIKSYEISQEYKKVSTFIKN